jgi:hypothetical protein
MEGQEKEKKRNVVNLKKKGKEKKRRTNKHKAKKKVTTKQREVTIDRKSLFMNQDITSQFHGLNTNKYIFFEGPFSTKT